jgi:hypothetical protein
MVPMLAFADPLSRAFLRASRQAVTLANMPASLKPTSDISLSLWYRATTIDTGPGGTSPAGSELISGGDQYIMRLHMGDIEVSKRTSSGHMQCLGPVTTHLDGNWHHVAGVISPTAMLVYVDGVMRINCPNTLPILFDPRQRSVRGPARQRHQQRRHLRLRGQHRRGSASTPAASPRPRSPPWPRATDLTAPPPRDSVAAMTPGMPPLPARRKQEYEALGYDPKKVFAALTRLKAAFAHKDFEAFAKLVTYPLPINRKSGGVVTVEKAPTCARTRS